uniref:Envelope protein n=1 Tax=Heterorhabditis bacteriophora TaxID=37862 RepID=A0A1I7X8Z3_HETBA
MAVLPYLFLLFCLVNYALSNELIVETFENWDFGHYNSHSFELLLVAAAAIVMITFILFALVVLFRALIAHCGSPTARRYDLPTHRAFIENSAVRSESVQSILIHSELIKLQGESVPTPTMAKISRQDPDSLLI